MSYFVVRREIHTTLLSASIGPGVLSLRASLNTAEQNVSWDSCSLVDAMPSLLHVKKRVAAVVDKGWGWSTAYRTQQNWNAIKEQRSPYNTTSTTLIVNTPYYLAMSAMNQKPARSSIHHRGHKTTVRLRRSVSAGSKGKGGATTFCGVVAHRRLLSYF